MDYTNAASFGFFNVQKHMFDTDALKDISINTDILPEIGSSGIMAGFYKRSFPVFTAIGDNQASFLGSVHEIEKSILVNIGTSGQISAYSDKFIKIHSIDTRPFPGGGYILVGAALCGGKAFEILKTFFEETIKLFIHEPIKKVDYYKLMTSVDYEKILKNNLPIVETFFNGTRIDQEKTGLIRNISVGNFTPENLIIGFLNGICLELFSYYNLFPDSVKRNKRILVGSGNAIRMNKILHNILERQFKYNIHIPKYKEEAAVGACLVAAVGGKYAKNYLEAGKIIESNSTL
jgi:sedoheptulokinase